MYEYVETEVRAAGLWRSYLALIRFHYHSSFIGVLLGALIVTRDWSGPLAWRILLVYVSMTVLLYGGLYSINAITDAEADSRHPPEANATCRLGRDLPEGGRIVCCESDSRRFRDGLGMAGRGDCARLRSVPGVE